MDSGTCGKNLTWTLDDEGTLTISGTGDMENYQNCYSASLETVGKLKVNDSRSK